MTDPYATLDPGDGSRRPEVPLLDEARASTVLVRGARKRCPRCGEGRVFDGWYTLKATCPRCSLRFEKEEGGFLGSMVLNYALAFGVWIAMLVVVLALTVPDVPVVPLLVGSVVVLVGVPLWSFPRSKTTWAAIEFLVHRSDPDYRSPVARDPRTRELE